MYSTIAFEVYPFNAFDPQLLTKTCNDKSNKSSEKLTLLAKKLCLRAVSLS